MATRYLSRALLSTTKPLTSFLSHPYTTGATASSFVFNPRSSFLLRLRPLVSAASATCFRSAAPVISTRGFATRQTSSSLNDPNPNWSNRPPKETILLDGCDFEHWLIVMEPPEGDITRDDIIDSYIKTLALVVGSEEEARMKIYSVSTRHYFAFGALVSEELSIKLKDVPKVRWVLPDSYLDVRNKDYGGEPFINGQAVPYDPKYHEEWVRNNSRANERNRRNDRPRTNDRSRNYERRRDGQMNNMGPGSGNPMGPGSGNPMAPGVGNPIGPGVGNPMGPPQNVSGPPPQSASNYVGGMPPQNSIGNYPPRGPPPPANNAPNFQYGPNSGPAPYQSGPGPNPGGFAPAIGPGQGQNQNNAYGPPNMGGGNPYPGQNIPSQPPSRGFGPAQNPGGFGPGQNPGGFGPGQNPGGFGPAQNPGGVVPNVGYGPGQSQNNYGPNGPGQSQNNYGPNQNGYAPNVNGHAGHGQSQGGGYVSPPQNVPGRDPNY